MSDRHHRKQVARARRRRRARKTLNGTAERPRLVVSRSLRNIEAQIIDDEVGQSILGLSTLSPDLKGETHDGRVSQGHTLGKILAERAREKGIEKVVFDRAGVLYHGIVKAVADGAREGGLRF